MVLLEIVSILGVVGGSALLLRHRSRRWVGLTRSTDAPARLLGWVTGLMAADRVEWGQAMAGELERVAGRRQRWHFALGCSAAALLVPPRRGTPGRVVVAVVAIAAGTCGGFVVYGVARYPAMVTGGSTWLALLTFAGVLVGFIVATLVIVRRSSAAGSGLAGGVVVAAVWIICGVMVIGPASQPNSPMLMVVVLMVALPLAPLVVGTVASWRSRTGAAGRQTALLAGVVAGLVLFLVLAGDALLTAGGPYDAGLVRDFPDSGLPDLATYAVSDSLGTAMNLLLVASTVTAACGCAGATISSRVRRLLEGRRAGVPE